MTSSKRREVEESVPVQIGGGSSMWTLFISPRGTLCKERNVEIDILTGGLRKKGEESLGRFASANRAPATS